jgi:hypothetical protein
MLVDRLRGGTIFLIALLTSCAPLAAPNSPSFANDSALFFTANFSMTSPVVRGTENDQLFFFVDPDAIIVVVPSLEDTQGAHNQKSLFLSKIGESKCAEKKNPPQLKVFTYYQECVKLISRSGNSFVIDHTTHGVVAPPGGGEYSSSGRFVVQISGGQCSAQLLNAQRSFVNRPGMMVPLTVRSGQCPRMTPPD